MALAAVKEKVFGKKEKDWDLKERFEKKDRLKMRVAMRDEKYAACLSDETYDSYVEYVDEKIFNLKDADKSSLFYSKMKEAIKRKEEKSSKEKTEDDATPKEEEKNKDPKKEEEKREKEENEKVINIVEKINEKEKAKQQKSSSDKNESKQPVEETKEETVKQDLNADEMISGIAKGVDEKYTNLFDKMRDDVKDLYDTVMAKEELKDVVKEYTSSIQRGISNMMDIDKDTLTTVVKSDKKLKQSLDTLLSLSEIASKSKDKDTVFKSIISIFIAPKINSFLQSVVKESKKDADSDEVLSAVKDKVIEFKNQVTETPDVIKDKLLSFIATLVDFNNNITTASESKYESKFIPKENKEEALIFGDEWKTEGIHFDFDKMNIPINPKPKMTKKDSKEIQTIINIIEPLIDKNKYQYNLDLLISGTYEFKLIESSGDVHRFIIDPGVVIGHGLFIYADKYYISFKEEDIITRLLNNPGTFKLSEEEINKCRTYVFKQDWLYNYIDMKSSKANKIAPLSQEQYYTLGDNLEKIIYAFYNNYGVYCRFRFKEFTNENTFVLASDRHVTNIINSNIPIAPVPTEIIYKDNKIIVNYGNQTNSFNL